MIMHANNIKISVLVPVYNVEKYIERCAKSLFEQTLKDDIEFIFVDDCSSDRSMQILSTVLSHYPYRKGQVKIIRHSCNRGLAACRAIAYMEAKGDFIVHCDSDDWVEPHMYESMYREAVKKNADIIFCDFFCEFGRKRFITKEDPANNIQDCLNKILRGVLHNSLWNKLIRRSVYERLNVLWYPGVNMLEDTSIIPRLIYNSSIIGYVSAPLYHYNQINTSSYTKISSDEVVNQIFIVYQLVSDFFGSIDCYKDSLCVFKQRILLLILLRCNPANRSYWKEKFHVENSAYTCDIHGKYRRFLYYCLLHNYDNLFLVVKKIENLYRKLYR